MITQKQFLKTSLRNTKLLQLLLSVDLNLVIFLRLNKNEKSKKANHSQNPLNKHLSGTNPAGITCANKVSGFDTRTSEYFTTCDKFGTLANKLTALFCLFSLFYFHYLFLFSRLCVNINIYVMCIWWNRTHKTCSEAFHRDRRTSQKDIPSLFINQLTLSWRWRPVCFISTYSSMNSATINAQFNKFYCGRFYLKQENPYPHQAFLSFIHFLIKINKK